MNSGEEIAIGSMRSAFISNIAAEGYHH